MPTANPTRLCIRPTLRPGLDDQPFPEVLGRNGTLNRDLDDFRHLGEAEDSTYALSEAEFALDFEPWNEWLGMEIEADTLEKYLASEIAAHCLQEMTFFGFDEDDIGAERAELDRRVDELNAMQARPCWSPPIDRIGHVGTLNLWRDESDNQAENEIHP